jgi:hypothetical protein
VIDAPYLPQDAYHALHGHIFADARRHGLSNGAAAFTCLLATVLAIEGPEVALNVDRLQRYSPFGREDTAAFFDELEQAGWIEQVRHEFKQARRHLGLE